MTDTWISRDARVIGVATLALSIVGFALYRPWLPVPFDITDFSELLPLLSGTDSFGDAFSRVATYYRSHGRSNVVTSVLIAGNWTLAGENPIGWRLLRLVLHALPIAATIWLALRLRIAPAAAAIGASLLVVSQVAAATWLRLTGEPLALAFFAVALGLALDYGECARWRRRTLVLALLVIAMGLTKEIMLVCVPFLLVAATTWRSERGFGRPVFDGRRRLLILTLVSTALVVAGFIALMATTTGSEAYVDAYGSARPSVSALLLRVRVISLPIADGLSAFSLPNLGFMAILGLGWWLAVKRSNARTLGVLAILLAVPVAGAAVYLPWERFELFYGFPFLLGPVLGLAVAVAALQRELGRRAWLAWLACGLVLVAPVAAAYRLTGFVSASRVVDHAIATTLPTLPPIDTLVVAVGGLPAQRWQGRGATYRRYALAMAGGPDTELPPGIDLRCADAAELLRSPQYRFALVSHSYRCGRLPMATFTFTAGFSYFDPRTLGVRSDTVAADLLVRSDLPAR